MHRALAVPATAHFNGAILVTVSAIVFSTAGVFTKGVDAGAWAVIFWRGIFAAAFTLIYVLWKKSFQQEFLSMGKSGWAAALVAASGTAAFIPAFKLTTIANVTLIYAAAPLLAALMAWVWIREPISKSILVGCIAAFSGVAIILQGSIGRGDIEGDLLALWMTIAMTVFMVIYRRYPETPAAGPVALSSIVLLPPAIWFGAPLDIPAHEILILAAFGLVFAVASVTLTEGTRRIPASEAGLISNLDIPLAPLLAWFLFAEVPANTAFIGGGLIMAAVIGAQIKR